MSFDFIQDELAEANRVLTECALRVAGDSAEIGRSFKLQGDQITAFSREVGQRCSSQPLSGSNVARDLTELIDCLDRARPGAIVFHVAGDDSATSFYYEYKDVCTDSPTSFSESMTRSPDTGWTPSDLPAPDTRLP